MSTEQKTLFATLICSYKKGNVIYAQAKSKDDIYVFFYLKVKADTDINKWLKSIYTFARNNDEYKINQNDFNNQFEIISLGYGVTEYIHKKDNSVKFRVNN